MNRATLSKRITSILADLNRLTNALYAMNTTDIQRYPDNYEVLSTDAALRAESITCRLRHLVYSTTNVKKEEYLTSAAAVQGINIQEKRGILEITLPCLLPKRKQRQSTEYLLDPFTAAMSQYAKSHPMPLLQHCVVCFSHVYCQDLPQRRVRDYDNLELKQFLDVAASFIHSQVVGEEYSDGWTLKLTDVPLSKEELAALLTAIHADDYDWDATDCGENPIWELSQGIAQKLIALMLPFSLDASHAADDGVWFTGSVSEEKLYVVTVIRQRVEGLNTELY